LYLIKFSLLFCMLASLLIRLRIHFLIVVFGCTFLAGRSQAALIGYWPLDQIDIDDGTTANLAYTSGSTFLPEASLTGSGFSIVNHGSRNNVLQSAGNNGSYIATGVLPTLTQDTDFTWSFFVQTNQSANSDVLFGNRGNNDGVSSNDATWLKFTHTKFEWQGPSNSNVRLDYDPVLSTGSAWTHLAVVKDGLSLKLYQNGVELTAETVTLAGGAWSISNLPLNIAGDLDFPTESSALFIDDMAVFDHALSASDIAGLANGTLTPLNIPEPAFSACLAIACVGIMSRRKKRQMN